MKSTFSLLVLAILSTQLLAQTAPDFTATDIDGNSHRLYDELDAGNIVVLKFFTNWCPICNNTADEVQALYDGYQSNGDPVVFWALDRDQNETTADAITYRNNNSLTFPVFGEAFSIAQLYGVVYQPEYYIVNPNRDYVKKTSYSQIDAVVQGYLNSLGIKDVSADSRVILTSNVLTWMASSSQTAHLSLIDVSGREVLSTKINGQQKISIDLPSGVYIYQLKDADNRVSVGKLGHL